MTTNPRRRTEKNPLAAGRFGMIGSPTEVLETPPVDFTNDCYIGATLMPHYYGAVPRRCHVPFCMMSTSRVGGAA